MALLCKSTTLTPVAKNFKIVKVLDRPDPPKKWLGAMLVAPAPRDVLHQHGPSAGNCHDGSCAIH
jgi:hypothetical protein